MTIYITKNGQTTGPFDIDTVNSKLRLGELQPTDLAWSEGAANWGPLSLMEGVQVPEPGTVPPPPPPAAPTNFPPTGMPTLLPPTSPFSPLTPPPSSSSATSPGQQAYPAQQPYPPQQAYPAQQPYPAQRAPSGDFEEERIIFNVGASPIAMSLRDLLIGCLTAGIWLIYVVALNSTTRYKLTNQRLTLRSGLLSQQVDEIENYRIRDVSIEQGTGGLLLGFGDVVVHANDASTPRLVLRHAPSPGKLKEQIRTASRQGRRNEGIRTNEFMG